MLRLCAYPMEGDIAEKGQVCGLGSFLEPPAKSKQDLSLLAAALQQISVLNMLLAHRRGEFMMVRIEMQHLRGAVGALLQQDDSPDRGAEQQRMIQQIGDFMGDIRLMQSDFAHHRQKWAECLRSSLA